MRERKEPVGLSWVLLIFRHREEKEEGEKEEEEKLEEEVED